MPSRRIRFLSALLAMLALPACALAAQPAATSGAHYRVVAYDTAHHPIPAADVDRIDTLIFAFARPEDGRVTLAPAGRALLQQRIALKAAHPKLKVMVSVGGWSVGGFSEAAMTPESRQRFADSAAALLVETHADGLDVDWEYPGHHESGIASSPQDREHFTALLKTLRATLDRAGHGKHYLLTIAAADGPFVDGIDIAAVAPSLDWFNLMTYDFCNVMTPTTCNHTGLHASALAPADARTLARAVRQFLAAGVPPAKLVPGVAFYGREFADVDPAHHGMFQKYGHYQGGHDWPQLKADFINHDGYVRYWDAKAEAPYLWNEQTHRFITYDDPQSIAAKAAYVKAQHLGGLMYWEQGSDPDGELLKAVWQGLQ
ncbi:glycoside hydrolase family 18 protein [Rhodanobacter sp. Si-c]|uniref:chitinase n=1 Tax=Rhodanobacter lycopersici TaxID=3162487 RepID=A0ABV3QGH2_9GAMM